MSLQCVKFAHTERCPQDASVGSNYCAEHAPWRRKAPPPLTRRQCLARALAGLYAAALWGGTLWHYPAETLQWTGLLLLVAGFVWAVFTGWPAGTTTNRGPG